MNKIDEGKEHMNEQYIVFERNDILNNIKYIHHYISFQIRKYEVIV